MFKKQKGQVALEFMMIFVFVIVVLSLLMYFLGVYFVDANKRSIQLERDDVAKSIFEEFEVLDKTQGGFSRRVDINPVIMAQYNITMNATGDYLEMQDLYHDSPLETIPYNYNFPSDVDFDFYKNYSDPNNITAYFIIYNNRSENYDGLILD